MLIGEVMKRTGLTRKALHYYESVGLVAPAVAENGYRMYDEDDVERLGTIQALRQLDMPLELVDQLIHAPGRAREILSAYRSSLEEQMQRLSHAIGDADEMLLRIDRGQGLTPGGPALATLDSKLHAAFPGGFGRMLAEHFRPFAGAEIDSLEKREAFADMMDFLDNLEVRLPELPPERPEEETALFQKEYWKGINELLALPEQEKLSRLDDMKRRKEEMEAVLASEAPGQYQLLKDQSSQLKELLGTSGYYEHVVGNLRVLCPEYDRYLNEMERLQKKMSPSPIGKGC